MNWQAPSPHAAKDAAVKGFAVGRTIFDDAAQALARRARSTMRPRSTDMAARFQRLVDAWQRVAAGSKAA